MGKSVTSMEVLGTHRDELPNSKYMISQPALTARRATLKSDVGAVLKTDMNGRLATAKIDFTGRKYGPLVERKEVISQPIANRFFGWIKSMFPKPLIVQTGPRARRPLAIITPMQNIQARAARQAQVIHAAKASSYIHKYGDWAISYKRHKPMVPPRQIVEGAPGLAPSMGQYDTFALRNWEDVHGKISPEAVSPYYARTMRR